MTLVVLAANPGTLVGLSDFMLSKDNLSDGIIDVPSVYVDQNRRMGSIYDSRLGQKFVSLGDGAILGMSGDYELARGLYADFSKLGPLARLSDLEIESHFRKYLTPRQRDLAALLAINRHPVGWKLMGGGITTRQTINDLEFAIIGSGTSDFLRFLAHQFQYKPQRITAQHVPGLLVGFAAESMMGQRLGDLGIDNKWGGAFEIICANGGKFESVDNVLYWSVEIKRDEDGTPWLSNQGYYLISHKEDWTFVLTCGPTNKRAIYSIPPISERPRPPGPYGGTATIVATMVGDRNADNSNGVELFFDYRVTSPSEKCLASVTVEGDKFTPYFDKEYLASLKQRALAHFGYAA